MSHGVTHVTNSTESLPLFPNLLGDRLTAIEADVDAAGGKQVVGHRLGLHDDPVEAGKLLSNKIRRNGRHRLTDEEVWSIRQWARESASAKSRLTELECKVQNFDGRWLTTEDIKARRKKRKSLLLAELLELEREDE